jgi:hypothetical protein
MRWTWSVRLTRARITDGEVVWSGRLSGWCLVAGRESVFAKAVTSKPNLAGESTYKP